MIMMKKATEFQMHVTIMEWCRHHKIDQWILHYPSEGKRTPRAGKHLKDMGMQKGVPDLQVLLPKHGYVGGFIELKSKVGRLSPEQNKFINRMKCVNYMVEICYSIDDALETLSWYFEVGRKGVKDDPKGAPEIIVESKTLRLETP